MTEPTDQPSEQLIQPLGKESTTRRDWTVRIDGTPLDRPSLVTISAPQFGCLRYGLTPGGYDSWSFAEAGGGGVVIIPFCFDDQNLLVGVVWEQRHNLGGVVANIPRGFTDLNESPLEAARRELLEETGLVAQSLVELPGGPVNCNSAFFETPQPDSGVRFFAHEIDSGMLSHRNGILSLRDDAIRDDKLSQDRRSAEGIKRTEFLEWHKAAELRDMFTLAAVARLSAWLMRNGRHFI